MEKLKDAPPNDLERHRVRGHLDLGPQDDRVVLHEAERLDLRQDDVRERRGPGGRRDAARLVRLGAEDALALVLPR